MGQMQIVFKNRYNTLFKPCTRFDDAHAGYDANQLGFFAALQFDTMECAVFEESYGNKG